MSYRTLELPADSSVLVTGGAGFIGSNLCEALLAKGAKVRCLDDLSTGSARNLDDFWHDSSFQFVDGDVRDFETCLLACKGIDYVLHQAAWGSVPRSIAMPLFYEEVNIKGTLNMLEAARQSHVKKFVYASSSSVYGDHQGIPKLEGHEGLLLSPYAVTKRATEDYADLYHRLYGLDTYGLRYFNVFGRRQSPDGAYAAAIPKFIAMLLRGESPTIYGDGRQSRDFTYVENVVEANLRACLAPDGAAGQVFNIAGGGREYLIDVYDMLCDALGRRIPPAFAPARVGDILHSNASIEKARTILGYDPEFSFEDGINLALGWYVENLTDA